MVSSQAPASNSQNRPDPKPNHSVKPGELQDSDGVAAGRNLHRLVHRHRAEFQRRPRLIRQSSDRLGNDGAGARYESDVAWFVMETIRNRHSGNPSIRVSPAARTHLDQVVRLLEERIDDIRTGSTDCDVLNELTFLADVAVTETLVDSTAGPVATPSSLDPLHQASLGQATWPMRRGTSTSPCVSSWKTAVRRSSPPRASR